jgi:hypothetical protein
MANNISLGKGSIILSKYVFEFHVFIYPLIVLVKAKVKLSLCLTKHHTMKT